MNIEIFEKITKNAQKDKNRILLHYIHVKNRVAIATDYKRAIMEECNLDDGVYYISKNGNNYELIRNILGELDNDFYERVRNIFQKKVGVKMHVYTKSELRNVKKIKKSLLEIFLFELHSNGIKVDIDYLSDLINDKKSMWSFGFDNNFIFIDNAILVSLR